MSHEASIIPEVAEYARSHGMSLAILDVLNERHRQRAEEHFSPSADDKLLKGELARAGACYAMSAIPAEALPRAPQELPVLVGFLWPFVWSSWKPKTPREDLVRAAALLIAEVERIDRASLPGLPHG